MIFGQLGQCREGQFRKCSKCGEKKPSVSNYGGGQILCISCSVTELKRGSLSV